MKIKFLTEHKHLIDLPYKTCILTISVGQLYHEADAFERQITLINNTFDKCHILIGDSLQRHTLMSKNSSLNEIDAYKIAIENGKEWLERNKNSIDKLTIPYDIYYWDNIIDSDEFTCLYKKINDHYDTHNEFFIAVNTVVEKFYNRNKSIIENYDRFKTLSTKYILEECAATILLTKLNANFIVYPRNLGAAMSYIVKNFIHIDYPNLCHFVEIR